MRDILLILALVGAFGLVGNIQFAAELEQEAEEKLARVARASQNTMTLERYAALLAGCLNSGALSWVDPLTRKEMLTFCRTHEAPVARD